MKKIKRLLPLVAILGLLAALPASAQVEATQDEGGSNLALLITINRLELTADQMQQIRDVLVGVLNEANALKEGRNAFEQQMFRFDGAGEELDALVVAFREDGLIQPVPPQLRKVWQTARMAGIGPMRQSPASAP